MTGPNFAEVTALVAVIEHKGFANAAKRLGLSPPRVSEMVRNLEERLGVRLVERTTRSLAPTEAGVLRTRVKYVAVRRDEQWYFVATQNTPVLPPFPKR